MVFLGGRRGRQGIYLHDPPPGYRRPSRGVPAAKRRQLVRREWILLRVLTVVLILVVVAFVALMILAIAA